MTTWTDYEHVLLALVMWREASGEGRQGMRAVGHVVRNRVSAHWGDITHVITDPAQFSSMTILGDGQTIRWPRMPDSIFALAINLADEILDDDDPDITAGAVYYFNPATATSSWFHKNVAAKKTMTATIGNHQFYSDQNVSVS